MTENNGILPVFFSVNASRARFVGRNIRAVCDTGKAIPESELYSHVGIAHTRWATHGVPSEINSHPQRSDADNSFVVVHNGIITNYKDVKNYLEAKGHTFESDTDTEIIAKLVYHLYREHPNYSFRELVEQVIQQLVSGVTSLFVVRGRCNRRLNGIQK